MAVSELLRSIKNLLGAKNRRPKEYYEFLPGVEGIVAEPPALSTWLVPLLLILMLATFIIWLSLSVIDIVSPAQAILIPDSRLQQIQSKEVNTIESILVQEGDKVTKGQVLINFSGDGLFEDMEILDNQIEQKNIDLAASRAFREFLLTGKDTTKKHFSELSVGFDSDRVQQVLRLTRAQQDLFIQESRALRMKLVTLNAEMKRMKMTQEKQEELIPFSEKRYKRLDKLYGNEYTSLEELEKAEERFIQQGKELSESRLSLAHKASEAVALRHERTVLSKKKIAETEQQVRDIIVELKDLQQQSIKNRKTLEKKQLRSPIDGSVNDITVHTTGGVVQSGETLMNIVPENAPLLARVKVLNRDIGLVSTGQKVNVKIDSFNFTKYGAITGVITQIADAAVEDQQLGSFYPVIVELQKKNYRNRRRCLSPETWDDSYS